MSTRIIDPPVSTSPSPRKAGTPRRSHPVAIEIPVTVQGSRSAPGRQLPQQFVEETRTVLVFVEGGVLRISEEVAPGQFLILKNLYNGEETPCVVVPKNIGSAKGYVEVEFAQPVEDFWGIDFATGQPHGAPIPPANEVPAQTPKTPASEKISATLPAAPVAIGPEAVPPSPVDAEMMKRALDAAFSSLPVSSPNPTVVEPPKARDAAAQSSPPASNWAKPSVWTETPARPSASPTNSIPPALSGTSAATTVLALQGTDSQGTSRGLVSLTDDIDQIVSKTPEPPAILRKAPTKAAQFSTAQTRKLNPLFDLSVTESSTHAQQAVNSADLPAHSEVVAKRVGARSGWKWMLTGFAVALLCMAVAAGGYRWFIKMPELPKASQATASEPSGTTPAGASVSNPIENLNSVASQNSTKPAETTASNEPASNHHASTASAITVAAATPVTPRETASQPTHLQSMLAKSGTPQAPVASSAHSNSAPAPDTINGISGTPTKLMAGTMGSPLPGTVESSAPAPPLAPEVPAPAVPRSVLQPALLLRSVPPIYPREAAERGDEGEVKIDAAVNEAGKVTEAKIVSGPMDLRTAAMAAVRQWSYQPAKLDGKTIATHVVVTLKFELKH